MYRVGCPLFTNLNIFTVSLPKFVLMYEKLIYKNGLGQFVNINPCRHEF